MQLLPVAISPTCKATVVVSCMCVLSTMVEGTCKMQIYNLKVIYCLRQFLLVANNVTLATIIIRYKVAQSLMLIHTTIVK